LVNTPALPQLRQLASREELMDPILQIAGLLGLSADKPEDILARVSALAAAETQLAAIKRAAGVKGEDATTQICARLTETAPDPARFVPMASFKALETQFASLQQEIAGDKVETALQQARDEGKLVPADEDWARSLASKDLGLFEDWRKSAPVRLEPGKLQLAGRQPPGKTAGDALDPLERQVASRLGIAPEEFLKHRNMLLEG
ncbi:phage protease, partial [Gemmobacter denitrificans]